MGTLFLGRWGVTRTVHHALHEVAHHAAKEDVGAAEHVARQAAEERGEMVPPGAQQGDGVGMARPGPPVHAPYLAMGVLCACTRRGGGASVGAVGRSGAPLRVQHVADEVWPVQAMQALRWRQGRAEALDVVVYIYYYTTYMCIYYYTIDMY